MAHGEASRDAPFPVPGESVCDDSHGSSLIVAMSFSPLVLVIAN